MSLLLFHQGNVPIIEDDMKFAKLPLPTNEGGRLDNQCTIYS